MLSRPAFLASPRAARWGSPVLLTLSFLVLLVLIPPRYEVPQNDDWAYYLTVQQWFETGRLQHLGWNDPTLLFQVAWGALFCKLFGLSYTSLRASTLVLAWIGVLALYGVLRRTGVARAAALLGAGVLLFHPIFVTLSYSFNTDVPYLALATAATWALLGALERPSIGRFAATGGLLAAGFLIRQQTLAIAVLAPFLVRREGAGRPPGRIAAGAALLLPVVAAVLLHRWWLAYSTHGEWAPGLQALHPFLRTGAGADLRALLVQIPRDGAAVLLDMGVLALPLAAVALASGWGPLRERRFLRWLLPLSVALFAAASFWLVHQQTGPRPGWPYLGNYLSRRGPMNHGGYLVRGPVWDVLTYAAPLLAGWLAAAGVAALARWRLDGHARAAAIVVLLGLAQFLPSLTLESVYDRYLLVLMPAAVVAALAWSRTAARRAWIGLLVLVPVAAVGIEYARDFIDHSRARWEAAEEVVARGVPPAEIALGFEWEGAHLYLDALHTLHARPPFRPGVYPWAPLVRGGYAAMELLGGRTEAPSGMEVLARRAYRPFFRRQPVTVVILGPRSRPAPPARAR